MTIWFIHHYATTPERNGYIRPYRFASHLKKIKTYIFASSYHHWSGENVIMDSSDYKIENVEGTIYVFIKTRESNSSIMARIINSLEFFFRTKKVAKVIPSSIKKPDVIIASSPHPLAMVAGIQIAKRIGVPCICEVRDLWPEGIFAWGKIKEASILGKLLVAGEHWIYKRADAIIFTKEGDVDYLYEKKWTTGQGGDIDRKKCFYINNGVDLPLYDRQTRTEILKDMDLEDESFKVIYAGAIRRTNDVENIINAAKILPENSNIKILIYGDGNLREWLERKVRQERINNVKFKGFVDRKYIPYILSKSSVNILNYTSSHYVWSRGNSSNKLFEYLASGRPVIATIKTGYSIIEKYDCGLEMENESPTELAQKILEIKNMHAEQYEQYCTNARRAAMEFDYEKLSEKLLDVVMWVRK